MSRHGKSKGKSRGDKPQRGKSRSDESVGDGQLSDTPRKVKVNPPKPQKSVIATESTGALPREDVVRQELAPSPARVQPLAEPEALPEPPAAESAVETLQRSFQVARLGTVEVNCMLIDIGRRNVASGLDFARGLATARTLIEVARLQLAFFNERMKTLMHQAEELRALSADLVARANEPIREHLWMKRMSAWWG
jgi:hypothetical protein